ncbi:hypothetical protein [Croceicoccus sp. Ery15]|nr:hypothetical protein [Croceicoccus sp. Ery15]
MTLTGKMSRAIIAAAKQAAWDRYVRIPHADPRVGREAYREEIARIEAAQ